MHRFAEPPKVEGGAELAVFASVDCVLSPATSSYADSRTTQEKGLAETHLLPDRNACSIHSLSCIPESCHNGLLKSAACR